MPHAFADPGGALSRGIVQGTQLGLAVRQQRQSEAREEFNQLQNKLDAERKKKEVENKKLEFQYDFFVKTKNVDAARGILQQMDTNNGTDLALRIGDDRMAEFNKSMKELDAADPSVQAQLMETVIKGFPTLAHLGGVEERLPAARKEATIAQAELAPVEEARFRLTGKIALADEGMLNTVIPEDVALAMGIPAGQELTFKQAQAAGFKPPSKPLVQNVIQGERETAVEKAYGKERGKFLATKLGTIQSASQAADKTLADLTQLEGFMAKR